MAEVRIAKAYGHHRPGYLVRKGPLTDIRTVVGANFGLHGVRRVR